MNTKNSLIALVIIDLLFFSTYFIYLMFPIYLGYYPIGIAQILLLIICLVFFGIYGKYVFKRAESKKDKLVQYVPIILLIVGYLISMYIIAISIFWWFAFMP